RWSNRVDLRSRRASATQQRNAGGRTERLLTIRTLKEQAAFGERIHVWGLRIGIAIRADGRAQIIDGAHQDVVFRCGKSRNCDEEHNELKEIVHVRDTSRGTSMFCLPASNSVCHVLV